jgi:hypothetical protein
MASEQQLTLLRRGVKAWNTWRNAGGRGAIDLSAADLTGVDLSKADLRGACLARAVLYRANLTRANLREADLSRADLVQADLLRTDLFRAKLTEADLSRTNIYGSNLKAASLVGATLLAAVINSSRLAYADLTGAVLGRTVFADLDMSAVKGLELAKHWAPSTVGMDTLITARGNMPDSFLRGCGIPDSAIDYARSLAANPIEFYSCFISHSSRDQDLVTKLHADLQAQGVRCWYSAEDLRIGDRLREVIHDSIRLHDKLLLVLSANSVDSQWVEEEVEAAVGKERRPGATDRQVLFPIRIDDAVMESSRGWTEYVRMRHIGDFTGWENSGRYQKALSRLLRDLKAGRSHETP